MDNRDNVRPLRRAAGTHSSGRRLRANWPAELRAGDTRLPCTVMDVSSAGACIRINRLPDDKAALRLIVSQMGPIRATIAWRKGGRAGVRFQEDQEWILEAHKKRFDPAAWLRTEG
jgi:hypothetical protein